MFEMTRKGFVASLAAVPMAAGLIAAPVPAVAETGESNNDAKENVFEHIVSVSAIAETLAAGEKVLAAAIEYDTEIEASSLDAGGGGIGMQAEQKGLGTYYVLGRSITDVYVASKPALSKKRPAAGKYVIVELDSSDANARTLLFQCSRGSVGCDAPVPLGTSTLRICQLKNITSASGEKIAGDKTRTRYATSSKVVNKCADRFAHGAYDDKKSGCHLDYLLCEPKGKKDGKKYPIVLFLPDAGVTSNDADINLRQGLGALSWAADGNCYVLTVAGACSDVAACLALISKLKKEGHQIDSRRVYGTGESAGCMALIDYASKHADDGLFAALFLVAGQGDMTPISKTPMFIMASEDDESSYGGMTAEDKGLSSIGVPFVDVQVDASYDYTGEGETSGRWKDYEATGEKNPSGNQEGAKELSSTRKVDDVLADMDASASNAAADAASQGAHVIFMHIAKGTLDGTDSSVPEGNTHNFTWQYAYQLPSIRRWIFQQKR